VLLTERDARRLTFVRAVEEADRDGALLPLASRAAATRRVHDEAAPGASDGSLLRARAALLAPAIVGAVPPLARLLEGRSMGAGLAVATTVAAAAAGALTNLLGPSRHVSILAFPLAGIVLWNLAVYAALFGIAAANALAGGRGGAGRAWHVRLAAWLETARLSSVAQRLGAGARSAVVIDSVDRFARLWMQSAGPLVAARLRTVLHLAAWALALGAIAGLYVSGVALEYRATWESTWLDAHAVQRYVNVVLGPAARVLGTPVPEVAALHGPGRDGSAAPWIHLWAATLAMFVLLPRGALALSSAAVATWRARRLPIPLDPVYSRRALSSARGASVAVGVSYYSCALDPPLRDRLHALLQALVGSRAVVQDGERFEYGDERDAPLPPATAAPGAVALVFALAQTPEVEVHGEFLQRTVERAHRAGAALFVVLETATFRSRVGSDARLRERLGTWDRLLREHGLDVVPLDEREGAGEFAVWATHGGAAA
jgi:hypothetical protein